MTVYTVVGKWLEPEQCVGGEGGGKREPNKLVASKNRLSLEREAIAEVISLRSNTYLSDCECVYGVDLNCSLSLEIRKQTALECCSRQEEEEEVVLRREPPNGVPLD